MRKDDLVVECPSGTESQDGEEVEINDGDGNEMVSGAGNEPSPANEYVGWHKYVLTATDKDIGTRFTKEVNDIIESAPELTEKYCILLMLKPEDSINSIDLDRIFRSLKEQNENRTKDVLLVIYSRGGSIEPAYQISKLCKSFSKNKFIVAVPRQAKSAATLIALGADEIHIGPLGQLGPIDPQLGGLPALGVSQALNTIASLSEKYPKSALMFARYLNMALTVEQIGYCDRVSESAAQYAERLLLKKNNMSEKAQTIAKELVYEYKDHGFVIDLEEAYKHLGSEWVKTDTVELALAERIYNLFDLVNLFMGVYIHKRMLSIGKCEEYGIMILPTTKNK